MLIEKKKTGRQATHTDHVFLTDSLSPSHPTESQIEPEVVITGGFPGRCFTEYPGLFSVG